MWVTVQLTFTHLKTLEAVSQRIAFEFLRVLNIYK
jgi:hypothetical protein